MIASILGALLYAQATPPKQLELPWASSPEFRRDVIQIRNLARNGKFVESTKLLAQMPTLDIKVKIDWTGVPAARKPEWSNRVNASFAIWTEAFPGLKIALSEKAASIKISFAPKLPATADTLGPAGAVFFSSNDPADAPVEGVIALNRTDREVPITGREIQNEISYAVAKYLGLDRTPRIGMATDRAEGFYQVDNRVSPALVGVAKQNQEILARLRLDVRAKRAPSLGVPRAFVDLKQKDVGTVDQGEIPTFSFQVTNQGDGPLLFKLIPDCGCFRLAFTGRVEAGKTELVRVSMDTSDFPGPHKKALFFYSNDPDFSAQTIPITFNATPLVQWIGGDKPVYLADESGLKINLKAIFNKNVTMVPERAILNGVKGIADLKPWTGTLAGKKVSGYEINILISPDLPPGRLAGNLRLVGKAGSVGYSPLWGFLVQKGISAFPAGVYFGEIPRQPQQAFVTISRPERSFKILKVEINNPHLTPKVATIKPGEEYRISVDFDGKGEYGLIDCTLVVTTDDPKQPTLSIPVMLTVR